jgi:hypothetical protein
MRAPLGPLALKAVPWPVVAVGSAPALVVLVLAFAFHADAWAARAVQIGLLMLAVPASFLLDDPTAATVEATPRSPWWTLATRLLVLGALLALLAGTALAWGSVVPTPEVAALALAPVGVAVVAVAAAALLRRAGRTTPGDVVAGAVGFTVLGLWLFAPESTGATSSPGSP